MPRPKRKRLKFDEDSVNDLLQEIYNDTHNIRAKIARLFTKWEAKVKEGGEIAALGETIAKLIVAEAKTVDQKMVLLRYLKEVVFAKDIKTEEGDGQKVTKKDRNDLIKQVSEQVQKSN
jgi:hypothetical protein